MEEEYTIKELDVVCHLLHYNVVFVVQNELFWI